MGWYSYKKKYPKFGGALPFSESYGMLFFVVACVVAFAVVVGAIAMKLQGLDPF